MQKRDYDGLRLALQEKRIRTFLDVFEYVDKNSLFRDAGLSGYSSADRRIKDHGLFKVWEVQKLAAIIKIDWKELMELLMS